MESAVLKNIEIAKIKLRRAGIEVTLLEGGFFLWVDINDAKCSSDYFVRYALENHKLLLISGSEWL